MNTIRQIETTISQLADSEEACAQLKENLREIIESDAFRGSERCGRFLSYIVNQAIAGHFESLKERVIGVEVFGRAPDYSTSDDAIVRVTASDVRRRLQQHYRKSGTISRIHISLPVGSYVPEIIFDPEIKGVDFDSHIPRQNLPTLPASHSALGDPKPNSIPASIPTENPRSAPQVMPDRETVLPEKDSRSGLRILAVTLAVLVLLLAAVSLALWAAVRNNALRTKAASVSVLPWSAFFASQHPTHLITSDPEIVSIQQITRSRVSLLDYVNHNYLPEHYVPTPEVKQALLSAPKGDWTPPGDLQIAVNVAELAQSNSKNISVQPSSKTRMSDLKSDDNFIFLGSPRSDPWVSLFNDTLDFQFVPVDGSQNEVIRNVHPRQDERATYTPTTGTTGESYAIVAFVQNPGQDGQVLVVAGATGEGTDVAGRLVTDPPRLAEALQKCGTPFSGSLKHFELLLRVSVIAGSSRGFDVMACHVLPGTAAH
jgi:hypothetical protein